MNGYQALENTVRYLETVIENGTDIDYKKISGIVGYPAALFQRIFTFVAGMSISEYVRQRRLFLSGLMIRHTDQSITEIAFHFGFGSSGAFSRAFREHHGVTPTAVRAGARLKDVPELSFKNLRLIGGKQIMAEMTRIEYVQCDERIVAGMMRRTTFEHAGTLWRQAFENGIFEKLKELDEWLCTDLDLYVGLGHMSRFSHSYGEGAEEQNSFQYIIGKFLKREAPVPKELYTETVPAGTVAKIWIEADTLDQIIECAYLLCTEAVEKTGYEIDDAHFYWCDIYTQKRYQEPWERGGKVTLDYILPVKKAAGIT